MKLERPNSQVSSLRLSQGSGFNYCLKCDHQTATDCVNANNIQQCNRAQEIFRKINLELGSNL